MTPAEIGAVEAVLGERVLAWRNLAGGYSHETCALGLASGRAVVRLGGGAPAIEAAVMRRAGNHVPVPRVRVVQESYDSVERAFMVIDHAEGRVLSELIDADALPYADLHALGREVARTAHGIGAVEIASAPGFFTDATLHVRPERPWSQQLADVAAECMAATPGDRLDPAARDAWVELCAAHAPSLAEIDAQARLVHSDFNPKNILATRTDDGWHVAAMLDWEFAYAGCPFADAGNMLRQASDHPCAYVEGFVAGYGELVAAGIDWEYLGAVIDMFALSDLVTRPLGHPIADQAAERIRGLIADGLDRSCMRTDP